MKVFIGQMSGLFSTFSGIEFAENNQIRGFVFLVLGILIGVIGVFIDD